MNIAPTQAIKTTMISYMVEAANRLAIDLDQGLYVLTWNEEFVCRAYSTFQDNVHFRVASLDDVYCFYSISVLLTK